MPVTDKFCQGVTSGKVGVIRDAVVQVNYLLHQSLKILLSTITLLLRCPFLFLSIVLLFFHAPGFSEFPQGPSLNNTSKAFLGEEDPRKILSVQSAQHEFLDVDEAYQLDVRIEGSEIVAEWVIADNYFLYGDKFQFSLKKGDKHVPLEASDPTGVIQYDEVLEKEVEKHYHNVRITLAGLPFHQHRSAIFSVTSQGCADAGLCYPPRLIHFVIEVDKNRVTRLQSPEEPAASTVSATESGMKQAHWLPVSRIIQALIGGIILNFMPCVFPILSVKALSIASSKTGSHSHRQHGWVYTLGVISAFILFANEFKSVG